jgi:hypothetical protein
MPSSVIPLQSNLLPLYLQVALDWLVAIFMSIMAGSTMAVTDLAAIIVIVFVLPLAFGVPSLLPKKFARPLPNLGHYLHH